MFVISDFCFEDRILVLIVQVPDHYLPFAFFHIRSLTLNRTVLEIIIWNAQGVQSKITQPENGEST